MSRRSLSKDASLAVCILPAVDQIGVEIFPRACAIFAYYMPWKIRYASDTQSIPYSADCYGVKKAPHARGKMANGANVARQRQPQTLKGVKIRGLITIIPVLGKHVSSAPLGYLHTVTSRCHAACSRSDDRGQSCVSGLCCPVNINSAYTSRRIVYTTAAAPFKLI